MWLPRRIGSEHVSGIGRSVVSPRYVQGLHAARGKTLRDQEAVGATSSGGGGAGRSWGIDARSSASVGSQVSTTQPRRSPVSRVDEIGKKQRGWKRASGAR